ncbi:MAG: 4Fe-4S binding protein [Chloroflexi bacterium]|nr:4Fe-4S binding protein [Chloroflexota bacterium]
MDENRAVSEFPSPSFDNSRCTGCGLCAAACPCGAIALRDGRPIFLCATVCRGRADCPSLAYCLFPCEEACPQEAIGCGFNITAEGDV